MASRDPLIDEAREARLVEWLGAARRVLAFCGAGVSAESGVPTFRGPGGLWEGEPVEEVATPQAFARDPQRVWRFYARRLEALQHVRPNAAHHALAAMERHYPGFLLVTQNVDPLHELAGSTRLLKIHGTLTEVRCLRCGVPRPLAAPIEVQAVDAGVLPLCDCGGLLRPNVIWFGETLNPVHFQEIGAFLNRGLDLLLVIGTSGEVGGGYGLTAYAAAHGTRVVEINPKPSALSADADLLIRAPAGELLERVWPLVASGSE